MYKIFYFISVVFIFCFAGTIWHSPETGSAFLVFSGISFGLGKLFKNFLNRKEN